MSLREFKQSLQGATGSTSSSLGNQTTFIFGKSSDSSDGQPRKPPKSSLRDHILSIEYDIARLSNPQKHQEVINGLQSRSWVFEDGLKRGRSDMEGFVEISNIADDTVELEDTRQTKKIRIDSDNIGGAFEDLSSGRVHADDDDDHEEDALANGERDSEAGLFIQAKVEGPFLPLVLWPLCAEEGFYSSEMERVEVPASINSRLLEHQREGVKFLYNLYREKRGGILGDDMGLGKTIQTIAFLAAVFHKDGPPSSHCIISRSSYSRKLSKESLPDNMDDQISSKVALIICPTSVIQNWQREFEAWGAFKLGIYHGAQRDLVAGKAQERKLDVVVTSHDTFRIYGGCLLDIGWDCVFVDEAHRLKSEKSQMYKVCMKVLTKRRYGLTGTIMQNKFMDLFNVFDWAAPGCLGTREHFKEYYEDPIKHGQRISAPDRFVETAKQRREHLLFELQKHLLRRTKQETIGHLLRGKEDNVVFCAMAPVQKRVYNRLLQSPDFQLLVNKDMPCSCGSPLTRAQCCHRTASDGVIWSYLHKENSNGCDSCPYCLILPCLTKLQQASNHLELLKPNPNDSEEKQRRDAAFAAIAFGEDASLIGGIQQNESFLGLSDAQHCGKMLALQKLLAAWTSNGDKVLLFSYSVKMLSILDKFLIRKGYCFSRLDGSTPMGARQAMVDDFNNSPSKQIFLISTRAGGLGLNLVSANRVVVFDPNWNPAQDLQAQDRSFRYGQKRHVTVFRLLAAGSLEELIYTRQIYKQQLFNIAVTGTLEKRYFDGVQDSKVNKGELFGVSNLFRDLSGKVFTSDIIELHEERLMSIRHNPTSEGNIRKGKHAKAAEIKKHGKAVDIGEEDEHGLEIVAEMVKATARRHDEASALKNSSNGENATQDQSTNWRKEKISDVLENAGVVYTHRNEEVVNVGLAGQGRIAEFVDGFGATQSMPGVQKKSPPYKKENRMNSSRLSRCNLSRSRNEKSNIKITAADKKLKHGLVHNMNKHNGMEESNTRTKEKSKQFQKLAEFKGLDETAFSKWLLSASQCEREKLLADYHEEVTRRKPC